MDYEYFITFHKYKIACACRIVCEEGQCIGESDSRGTEEQRKRTFFFSSGGIRISFVSWWLVLLNLST